MTAPDWATHRGWFGFCPVWVDTRDQDDGITVEPRHWSLGWLLKLSTWVIGAAILCYSWLNPSWEPVFPIRLTGEVKPGGQ